MDNKPEESIEAKEVAVEVLRIDSSNANVLIRESKDQYFLSLSITVPKNTQKDKSQPLEFAIKKERN